MIMSFIGYAYSYIFSYCARWFNAIFDSTSSFGSTAFYISTIGLVFAIRFFLHPIFGGSSGSDRVRKLNANDGSGDPE